MCPTSIVSARFVLWAVLLLPYATAQAANAPFSFDTAPGRLPKDVVPLDYAIGLKPDVSALTIAGSESVRLRVRTPVRTLQLNSLNETLREVRFDGVPVQHVDTNNELQLTTITLAAPAAAGIHTLSFVYRGTIETEPRGLFVQRYTGLDGRAGLMLSTQLEQTEARRVFPCWDEPAFRASFRLTAVVPAAWATVSNMPIDTRTVHGALATVKFQRTPNMPTYLVEFTAGELENITADGDGTHFGVWAIRGRAQDGRRALANAQQILADYNEYFGYRYPLPKLDSIAVPGSDGGAMENWGAITYTDQLLLLTPSSTAAERQEVFSTEAHEIAHQWNGDLVTMGWWDDIWLNESFASWRAAEETDLRNPDWKWWEAQDLQKEQAMTADARISSHAIQQQVTDELQADNAFDPDITYNKGQAVLRMFEAYLGPVEFRDGVRRYIKSHAYSNATTADLWEALSAATGKNVGSMAADWTEQPGFPLVTVTAECDAAGRRTVSLSQSRFLSRGADPGASRWQVPLRVRWDQSIAPKSVLLERDGQTVAAGRCDEALSVNADAIGYYRAKYDQTTLATITRRFDELADGDRIALLDDEWALVESGLAPLANYLALATSMGANRDARAWEQITGALDAIEHYERGLPGHRAFAAFAASIIKPIADQLGWDSRADEPASLISLRHSVLGELGAWGDQSTIDEARRRYKQFLSDPRSLSPEDQWVVFSIVARYADATTFEQLHSLAKAAGDQGDSERYYRALMRVGDAALAAQAAEIAVSPELPPQLATVRLWLILAIADQHQRLAWTALTKHVDEIMAPFTSFAPQMIAENIPTFFWEGIPLDEIEAWVKAKVPAEMAVNVERGMESARFDLSAKTALVAAADEWVQRSER